jgi:uncharacterized protein YchJ
MTNPPFMPTPGKPPFHLRELNIGELEQLQRMRDKAYALIPHPLVRITEKPDCSVSSGCDKVDPPSGT